MSERRGGLFSSHFPPLFLTNKNAALRSEKKEPPGEVPDGRTDFASNILHHAAQAPRLCPACYARMPLDMRDRKPKSPSQFKVEGCPYCRTNSRGGVSSAFSTSWATARKRQRGVRRGCFSILHANRPESHSANLIPVTRCGRRCCTTTSASSCSLWMNSWRFWRSAEGNFSFGSG